MQSGISETRINQWRETRACRPPPVASRAEVNRRSLQRATTLDKCGQRRSDAVCLKKNACVGRLYTSTALQRVCVNIDGHCSKFQQNGVYNRMGKARSLERGAMWSETRRRKLYHSCRLSPCAVRTNSELSAYNSDNMHITTISTNNKEQGQFREGRVCTRTPICANVAQHLLLCKHIEQTSARCNSRTFLSHKSPHSFSRSRSRLICMYEIQISPIEV